MTATDPVKRRGRVLLLGVAAVVVLAATTTLVVAAASGAFGRQRNSSVSCAVPVLPGAVVAVSLVDMNGGRGMMRGGQSGWRTWTPGMMQVFATPQAVPSGTVSLRATNLGVITHELVVLPLANGQNVGTRTVGQDGKVDEAGSPGEVSATCAVGAGEGLSPGTSGWTTLTLPAGRYELLCNLPGHYVAGMYRELVVT